MGAPGYMNWEEIQKISKENFVEIGNHSHTHEYLVDEDIQDIKKILLHLLIFLKNLGKILSFFLIHLENTV